jgi:hypothetical protein
MPQVDFTWRDGQIVRFDVADDVADPEDILTELSYAILSVETGDRLEGILSRELAGRNLSVKVHRRETSGVPQGSVLIVSIRNAARPEPG